MCTWCSPRNQLTATQNAITIANWPQIVQEAVLLLNSNTHGKLNTQTKPLHCCHHHRHINTGTHICTYLNALSIQLLWGVQPSKETCTLHHLQTQAKTLQLGGREDAVCFVPQTQAKTLQQRRKEDAVCFVPQTQANYKHNEWRYIETLLANPWS